MGRYFEAVVAGKKFSYEMPVAGERSFLGYVGKQGSDAYGYYVGIGTQTDWLNGLERVHMWLSEDRDGSLRMYTGPVEDFLGASKTVWWSEDDDCGVPSAHVTGSFILPKGKEYDFALERLAVYKRRRDIDRAA